MRMNASMEEERNDRIAVEGSVVSADIRRDPSFSGWYDEDDAEKLNLLPLHLQKITEEGGFRLPLPEEEDEREERGECAIGINPLSDCEDSSDYRDVDDLNCLRGKGDDRKGGLHSPIRSSSSSFNENGFDGGEKFLSLDLESENHSRTSSPRQRIPSPRQTKYSGFEVENGDSKDATVDATQSKYSAVPFGTVIRTLILTVVWYFFSTCLTLYNKSLLGDHLGKFPAPLLMNTVHFSLQAILSHLILFCGGGRSHKSQPNAIMSWRDYFLRVVPTALGTALDINLSNASLVFISVTFATMCKSAGPIFLLLFAFGFKLETPSLKLLGIMLVISAGVLLTVSKETQFELWGFLFVMLAAVMSGFRWSMTQILLQREVYGLKNPITLMSYVTPVMALATFLLSLVFDPWKDFNQSNYFNDPGSVLHSSFLMIIGGALAFCMVLTEYVLVSATSAVTVTIAGIMKEAVTIVVAVVYFHDEFTVLKGVGLVIIMVGVGLFNWYKYQKLQNEHLTESGEYKVIPNGAAKYVILDNMDDLDAKI